MHTIIKKVWEFYYDFIKKKKNNIYCIQCIFVNISIYTPIGFKSDNRGDNGSKYSNLAEAEDYINKFAML